MQPQSVAMQCSEKMVVTLAVQSAASLATETLQFNVPCINRQSHPSHLNSVTSTLPPAVKVTEKDASMRMTVHASCMLPL